MILKKKEIDCEEIQYDRWTGRMKIMEWNEKYNNTRVGYMLEGARRSRCHFDQWVRYLRKGITDEKILLSEEEITDILGSGALTMVQMITFKRAMEPGTITNKKIAALNQKSKTPMVEELLRRHRNV